jgi:PAS domain S-box-containing protein
MINKDKNALNLVKQFCKTFYSERNLEDTLKYLSDNIVWIGTNKKAKNDTYDSIKDILCADISFMPSHFKIKPISEFVSKIDENVFVINYSFTLIQKKKNLYMNLNLFANVKYEGEIGKIVIAKFDFLDNVDYNSNAIIQHTTGGLMVFSFVNNSSYPIKLLNIQFTDLFNLTEQNKKNIIGTNLLDYIHNNDIEIIKHLLETNRNSNVPFTCNFRVNLNNTNYIWIIALIVAKKEDNNTKYYCIARPDCSYTLEQKEKTDTEQNPQSYLIAGTHINSFDKYWNIEEISESLCNLLHYEKKELLKFIQNDYKKLIHKDDIIYFDQIYKRLKTQRPKSSLSFRLLTKDGTYIWVSETLEIIKDFEGKKHIFAYVEELNNLKEDCICNCKEKDLFTPATIYSKFLMIDLVNKKFETDIFENSNVKFKNKYVTNIPNSLIENNIIYEEDTKSFLKFFNDMHHQRKNSWTGRINLKNKKIGWFNLLTYTLFNNGMPIKAVCIIISINSKNFVFEQFSRQKEILQIIVDDYAFIGEYDILTDKPILLYSPKNPIDFFVDCKKNNFEYLVNKVIHKDYIKDFISIRDKNINCALNNIVPENTELDVKLKSLSNRFSGFKWFRFKFIHKFDPISKHLHLIVLVIDIHKEKMDYLSLLDQIEEKH